jgi:tetratricopeptide (TPR) repeat protein
VSVLGIAFAAVAVVALVMSLSRDRALALGLVWLAITFAPVSNLVSGVVLQERTLMLPSVGAMMVFGVAFQWLWREASTVQARRAIAAVVAMMAILGAWRSGQRNPVWRDNLTLFTQTAQDAPLSYRAHYVYGSELFNVGRPAEGERELRRAIALARNDSDPYNFLAAKYSEAKLYAQAIPLYRMALEIRPGRPDSRFGLAFSLLETGDAHGALAHADTGLAFGQLKSYFDWVKTRADSALRAQRVP